MRYASNILKETHAYVDNVLTIQRMDVGSSGVLHVVRIQIVQAMIGTGRKEEIATCVHVESKSFTIEYGATTKTDVFPIAIEFASLILDFP